MQWLRTEWTKRTHKTRTAKEERYELCHPGDTCLKEPTLPHSRLRTKWRGSVKQGQAQRWVQQPPFGRDLRGTKAANVRGR